MSGFTKESIIETTCSTGKSPRTPLCQREEFPPFAEGGDGAGGVPHFKKG
jgi:hypothetical protein